MAHKLFPPVLPTCTLLARIQMLYFCHRVNRIHVHLTTSERGTGSVDLGLVARAVLDALRIKILLDVFGDSTLHCDRIQPPHVFIYTAQTRLSRVRQKKRKKERAQGELVLCQRPTQLFSGFTTATVPSK